MNTYSLPPITLAVGLALLGSCTDFPNKDGSPASGSSEQSSTAKPESLGTSETVNNQEVLKKPAAHPDIHISISEYLIYGNTPEGLLKEMKNKGNTGSLSAEKFFARTYSDINWTYRYEKTGRFCQVRDVTTQLDLTYVIPKWSYSSGHHPRLRQYWNQFLSNLLLHEIGHGRIAQDTRSLIQETLQSYQSREETCEHLGIILNAIGKTELTREKKRHADYDRKSGNGAAQGAYFNTTTAAELME